MKLHLPVQLFKSVVSVLFAAPFALNAAYTPPTEIIIPDGYLVVQVEAFSDITAYSSSSADVAFKLSQNLEIEGLSSALIPNSSCYFTSADVNSLSSLIFSNATTSLFNVADGEKLDFAYLKSLTFSGNTASSTGSYVSGGAIDADGGTVTLSGNGDVTFSGNTASGRFAYGGAIYAQFGTVTLSGNGDVMFSGNTASDSGGAIYAEYGTVTLSGNGDVLFEKNAEDRNATYRLRSIYATNLNLSASEGKKIEFRDSIYASGRVKLNEGGAGNIIFTGATTEADLLSIKGSAGADGEISDSRLSKLGHVELFGGSLMVQHQATLQSEVFMVKQAADATLVLENGHVDARHFIVNSGNTLSLKGKNTLSTGYGKIDGTMQFAVESTHAENALVSYSGFVDLSESSFDIQSTQTTASYQLLSLQESFVVKWNDDLVFTASGIDSSRLVWKDGVLYWDISGNVTESKQVLGDYIFSTDWTLQHVTDKNQITGTGRLAFCLDSDVEWDGLASSLINNSSSHVFITGEQSADGKPLYSFDFDNATSRAFNVTSLMVADLKEVTFSGNTASSTDSYARGGAISAEDGTVTLSGNGAVTFIGNWASDDGGAIYAEYGTVTLSGNGDVTFSGNTASSTGSSADGGAIEADVVTLSDNGDVTFSGNTASGSSADGGAIDADVVTLSDNGDVTFSGNTAAYGGAIYAGYGTVTLSDNGDVTFSGNTASDSGGAIYAYASGGTVTLRGNGDVTFSGNTASSTGSASYPSGGAISAGTVTLSGNGAVTFSGNNVTATGDFSHASGGAISAGTVTLSGNGDVTFSENNVTATGVFSYAYGGAISAGTVTLSGNGDVTFSGNTASGGSDAYGGAIDADEVTLSGNGAVTFSGNTAADGGAIDAEYGTVTLSGNGDVTFSGNTASGDFAYGGAIYASGGTVTLRGNGDILFEKNAEVDNGTYRLRSIHTENLNLSASEDKKIEFHDSIRASGTVNLNAVGTGDIIFTGATTEADLLAVKGGAGTADEILNSRTSVVKSITHLYGGRLRIEDGAVYQGVGLTVHENSAATVLLKDATMTHAGEDVSFASGTTLAAAGVSHLTAKSLTMADGAAWSFEVSASNATSAVLTYNGSLTLEGALTLKLTAAAGLDTDGRYMLLSVVNQPTNWEQITVTGGVWDKENLRWANNVLYINYPILTEATWNNASGDSYWNTESMNWEQDENDYVYQNGVQVVFGDEGAGTVTLVGSLDPESVLVNSTQNYSFEGAGKLTGGMKLTKQGSGTLTIKTDNDYTGGTFINGGKVVAGTSTALGAGTVKLENAILEIKSERFRNSISTIGDSTIIAINWLLVNSITNDGTLTLEGTLDASALVAAGETTLVDCKGADGGSSGFVKAHNRSVDIMEGSGTLISTNATITVDGEEIVLDAGGYATLPDIVYYDKYKIDGTNETVSAIMAAAKGNAAATDVELTSGSLSIDADMTGDLTLSGAAFASVDKNAKIGGDLVLNGGTFAMTENSLTISGSLKVQGATDLLLGGFGTEGLYKLLSFGSFVGDIALLNPMERMRASSKKTLLTTDDSLMLVVGDKLEWTGGNITDGKLDGLDISYTGDSNTSADITGDSTVTVKGCDVTLSGNNSYAGGTEINGGSLTAGHDTAFGTGDVTLNDGVLDLNNKKVPNHLAAHGGTIAGGSHYSGSLTLSGHVTLGGNLSAADATVQDGTKLTLNNHMLNVSGSLTMQGGLTLDLAGSSFGEGDTLITFGSFDGDVDDITLLSANGDYALRVDGNALILGLLESLQEPAVIDREACDTLVQANWGAFSASHAFTDAVHGQRTSAGYVAGGEATVWMSALGGMRSIDSQHGCEGADVDLYGAAFGIEMYLDEVNRLGMALGRVNGDVSPNHGGFSKVEQNGTYAALYGVHILSGATTPDKLLFSWSIAHGTTESDAEIWGGDASWEQNSIQLNARLDWEKALSAKTSMKTFVGLEYYANNSEDISGDIETGSVQNLRGEMGVSIRYTLDYRTAVYAELSYMNDMLRRNPNVKARGLSGQGANPGRHGIGISAGVQHILSEGWSVGLNYNLETMQNTTEHQANIGIGKRF